MDNMFYYAEVINSTETDTYVRDESNPNQLFAIDVRVSYDENDDFITNVVPMSNNIKQIPIIGETVLIFQADNYQSSENGYRLQWYYMMPNNITSGINNNILPIHSYGNQFQEDLEFTDIVKDKPISPLQPYRGDLLIEGRWGNSLRFGSTIEFKDNYSVTPPWTGDKLGDPIIILSNNKDNKKLKQFVVESFEKNSMLMLTSTQKLVNFQLENTRQIRKFTTESDFSKSQLIGIADRIILKCNEDILVADSPKSIVLNTPELLIGDDQADTPLVHGDILLNIFEKLLQVLEAGVEGGGLVSGFITNPRRAIKDELNKLNSTKFKIKK